MTLDQAIERLKMLRNSRSCTSAQGRSDTTAIEIILSTLTMYRQAEQPKTDLGYVAEQVAAADAKCREGQAVAAEALARLEGANP